MQLIEGIFVSEFDIDKGSTLRFAVPGSPLGYRSQFLPEHQLPEGAHNREYEFTVFYLYPDMTAGNDGVWYDSANLSPTSVPPTLTGDLDASKASSGTNVSEETAPRAGPGKFQLTCINVVRTRLCVEKRRGADVKAMAFATRRGFVDQLRPLLMACLDVYFEHPAEDTIRHLLATLNSIPVSTMPDLSRLQRAVLRGVLPIHSKSLSFVRPPPLHALSGYTKADSEAENLEKHLFWDEKVSLSLWPAGKADPTHHALASGPTEVHLRVPLFGETGTTHSASLNALVRRYGEGIMHIYNAVMLEKRVLFLGTKEMPAGEVCNAVLACTHLVSPPLANISHRLFPYANLNDLSFLKVPGCV